MATITQYDNNNIVIAEDSGVETMVPGGVVLQKRGTNIAFVDSQFRVVKTLAATEVTEVTDRNGSTTAINNIDTLFNTLADNFHFRATEPATAAVVEQSIITFTNRTFISGSAIPIVAAPGPNMFFDIISISLSKNLTTGYTRSFGSAGFDFLLGNQIITTRLDGIQIESAGIRAEKIEPIPAYSGDASINFAGIINRPIQCRTASLSGGVGTIKIYLTYTTHTI